MADNNRTPRITQRDIARLSEVSQATVSRVLAGDPRVDRETIERVTSVIEQSNYQPDTIARSLRHQRSFLIGMVVKRASGKLNDDPFFGNLTASIISFLGTTPYHLCVELSNDGNQSDIYDDLLRTRRVDGLILVESEARDERILRLQSDRFPFVLIGNPNRIEHMRESEEPLSVDNDNVEAGMLAAKHLINAGYQRIGFLSGPRGVTVSEDRITGYRQALAAAKKSALIWHSEFGLEAARNTATNIFKMTDPPDALVVLDDFMAMGVVLAARSCGISIPEQLGLVSFNDSSLCRLLDVGLTSVNLNIDQMITQACKRLLRVIEGKAIRGPKRLIVPAQLVARGSSKPTSEPITK